MKIKIFLVLILLITTVFIYFFFPYKKEVKKIRLLILCKNSGKLIIHSLQSAYYINNVDYKISGDTLLIKPYIRPVRGLPNEVDKGFDYSLEKINFLQLDTVILPVAQINSCN